MIWSWSPLAVNAMSWTKTIAETVFVYSAALTMVMPADGVAAGASLQRLETSDSVDEELIVSQRTVILLTDRTERQDAHEFVRFETDVCGMLQRLRRNPAAPVRSAWNEDTDGAEDDDPLDENAFLMGRWLAKHTEIAVINDGVAKSCDGEWDLVEDIDALFSETLGAQFKAPRIA